MCQIIVFEEGSRAKPADLGRDGFFALAHLYRDLGGVVAQGRALIPLIQGRAVGGGSVINGAISWRLPADVRDGWVAADPGLAEVLEPRRLEALFDGIERDLDIAPTPDAIAGPNNLLLAKGAVALGLEHRPIARNTAGCLGSGQCLEGCPHGAKRSMDRTYLRDAEAAGAQILPDHKVLRVLHHRGAVRGLLVQSPQGPVEVHCKAVVLAASALQSPALLQKSGLGNRHVGRHLMGHPGASLTGRFAEPVRMWRGATQGREVIGLRKEGLKFEALGYDAVLAAMRQKGVGAPLARAIDDLDHWAHWGVALRAEAEGTVRPGLLTPLQVRYGLTPADMHKLRRGVAVMARMMLAAGAELATPGVHGAAAELRTSEDVDRFEREAPLDPRAWPMAMTHLFGTCRMASDPQRGAVGPDFAVYGAKGVWVADSSVFPSNTGVNPQTSILALATLCAQSLARQLQLA
ncbi:MAG: GMC family oxidoreductase [Deltaproteobacteria bacterium]|nr:GMC family oxidoreductase [Deltaproteobacteria bacterium]